MANPLVQIILKAKDEISEVIGGITDSLRGFEDKTKEVAYASSLAFDEARYNFEQYGIAMGDMSTEYSGKFDEVTGKLTKLGDESVGVKDKSTGAFDEMKDKIKISFTEINQAIEIGMKIAKTAKQVYDNTVGKALTVAGEIEELMRVSGDAPETLSALRLEAEKASVPFDDLYKALENLNKTGVAPTVDNLVAIADQYVALKDPIEKATLLIENFGTAGDDIAPMLEAIAGGVKAVDDAGLIFTEEEIQQAQEYEEAVAELGLAWEGFTVSIGKEVIPALTDLATALGSFEIDGGGAGGFLSDEIEDIEHFVLQILLAKTAIENFNNIDFSDFAKALWDAFGDGTASSEDLIKSIRALGGTVGDTAQEIFDKSKSFNDYATSMNKAGYSLVFLNEQEWENGKAAEGATAATDNATWSVDAYGNAALEAGSEVEVFGSNSKRSAEEVDAMRIAAQETREQIEDLQKALAGANLELDVAIRTFSESIGGDLAQGLKDAGLEGDELLNRLGLIDQAFGTSYVLEYKLELATDDLLDTLINDPDNFLPDAQQFLDYFTPLQDSVIEAMGKVDELESQLSELERTWNIRVKITTEGGFPGGTTFTPPRSNHIPEASGGAVYAAAGVAASMPYYWVGERGPEPFFPSVDGRIVSNTQAMSALRGGAGTNAREIANAVKQGVKEAMRDTGGGKIYNLTMPTSSNPADVRTAFELMEAWA